MVDINLYNQSLRQPFHKLCRLRFLNPDGSTAFVLDHDHNMKRNKCFIKDGSLSVNMQNGQRRSLLVTLDNVDGEFEYNVNQIWFGNEVALDEGLVLLDGTEYYIQQGVFLMTRPVDSVQPSGRTISYSLVDKWANLDGTLYGNLEGAYEVSEGTNQFTAIQALLDEDKGNGYPVDRMALINGFLQYTGQITWENTPYTVSVDSGRTLADVVTGLVETLAGLVGYDRSGRLRIDPSSEDVDDVTKPVQWTFSLEETTLLGMTYDIKNEEVYNDYIVVGEQLKNGFQPYARYQNIDPRSDTNVNRIGRKTKYESASGYSTTRQCKDLCRWRLKRSSVLAKSVSISASQIFHIQENQIVEIIRTDKPGSPLEKHLVQGFSRPLTSKGAMTISAISTVDYPEFTLVSVSQGT